LRGKTNSKNKNCKNVIDNDESFANFFFFMK